MAFDTVDAKRLKSDIKSCLDALSYDKLQSIRGDFHGSFESYAHWSGKSKKTLMNAIETLLDDRYTELKNYLEKCLLAADYIIKYKEEKAKLSNYEAQKYRLQDRIKENSTSSTQYTVKAGDSLWQISVDCGVDMNTIAIVNGFSSIHDTLYVGRTLTIPDPTIGSMNSEVQGIMSNINVARANMSKYEEEVKKLLY